MQDRTIILLVGASFCFVVTCSAVPVRGDDDFVQKAYRLSEPEAKRQLDDFFRYAAIESMRKKKAGEPPASAKTTRDAIEGIKFFIYNRAATNGICAANASEKPKADRVDAFTACIERRNAAMEKFMKLGEYSSLPGNRRVNCELIARDFDSERRFRPFDFLQVGLGPPIFDFEVANDCYLTDRAN